MARPALWIAQLANEDLKWETGQSWGIAIEGRLFNRLNFNIEYFDKRNKDLLFDVYNPLSAGATTTNSAESVTTKNMGVISNRGVEISGDIDVYKTKDWKINVGANITFIKNKVLELPEQNKNGIISGTRRVLRARTATSSILTPGRVSTPRTVSRCISLTTTTTTLPVAMLPMVMPTVRRFRVAH